MRGEEEAPLLLSTPSIPESLIWWLVLLSVVTFLGALVVVPVLVIRIPEDYFLEPRRGGRWRSMHPVLGMAVLIAKNVLGAVLVAAGVAMLFLPGQGILSILMGVMLMDFPGKYALERRLVGIRPVHRAIDWIRRRAGHAPLKVPARRRRGAAAR